MQILKDFKMQIFGLDKDAEWLHRPEIALGTPGISTYKMLEMFALL